MAAETYVIGGLGTLVTILGTIVVSSLSKRLDTMERKQEQGDNAVRALVVAVAELTVEVKHLNASINKRQDAE